MKENTKKILEQLSWSSPAIAKNLNRFRKAEASDDFWGAWKEEKENIKNAGFSVYKEGNIFYVFDWSNKIKATQEEFDAQEKEREAKEQQKFLRFKDSYINEIRGARRLSAKQEKQLIAEAGQIESIDELWRTVQREANNPDAMWEAIARNA